MKRSGVIMERDPKAFEAIAKLQAAVRKVLAKKYGPEPYVVKVDLKFPETMPDYATAGADGTLLFLMAPTSLVPYGVYYFLELVHDWSSGAFHRMAGHVLQATVRGSRHGGLAFQEYSPEWPHVKHTLGYAGRPGGPAFYISIVDNTRNHGPGSQHKGTTEADTCFGKIVGAESERVVQRMKNQPGAKKPMGFVSPPSNYIDISKVRLLGGAEAQQALASAGFEGPSV